MSKSSSPGVPFILVTLLLDTLGIGLVIPVLPRLVTQMVGQDLAAGSRYFGLFVAIYAAMQFLFAPIIGGLSDRFGRRPVLLSSLFGAACDYLLLALAPSLGWLFLGRVIAGITGASISAASAYIADVTPPEHRAKNFGLVGAAFGLGFILGPALGGTLGGISLRLPFFVAAGLNAVNLLYGLFVLPESLAKENRRPFTLKRANPLSSLVRLGRHPVVLGLTGTLLCAYVAQQILQSVWALYTEERFAWSAVDVGLSLTVVGVMVAVVQGGIIRLVLPKIGERRALAVGLFMNVTGHIAFGLATQSWMMVAIIIPFSIGGLAGPAIQALLSREVGPDEQGELQGSLASLASVAAVVGPLVGTGLLAHFAPETAAVRVQGAPFFAAALLNVVGLSMALRLFAKRPAAEVSSMS